MILLILVALLWIAVLAPGIVTKISERRSSGSIDSFHDRLHLLERTGPKLIVPANRLERRQPRRLPEAVGESQPRMLADPQAPPALVLLETAVPEPSPSVFPLGPSGVPMRLVVDRALLGEVEREVEGPAVRMLDGPSLGVVPQPDSIEELEPPLGSPSGRPAVAERRGQAARRRRDIVGVLLITTVLSGLLGVVPSLRPALIATGVAGFLLIVFVGLAVYTVASRAARSEADRLASTANEPLGDLDASHVGPLRRIGTIGNAVGDDETEPERVVKAG
ncbi:MAG TPA: hypothetical protein VK217_03725 [Acidimicrobiales bacterium]|nr:hypothetical protein [Acidimicrobiales bacterium]